MCFPFGSGPRTGQSNQPAEFTTGDRWWIHNRLPTLYDGAHQPEDLGQLAQEGRVSGYDQTEGVAWTVCCSHWV